MKELFNTSLVVILVALSFMPSGRAQGLVVVDDNFIVQGSLSVGLDGTNGQAFGFTTMLLKENNVQMLLKIPIRRYPIPQWIGCCGQTRPRTVAQIISQSILMIM